MGIAFWLPWEPAVIVFLQKMVTPFLQKIFEGITFLGDVYAMILILGILYWGYKKELGKKIALYAITALVTSVAVNNIVKRRRPYFDHKDIKCLKPRTSEGDIYDLQVQGYSFPSGHATDSVSTYVALGFNVTKKVLKIILFILPLLIGLSRLALGVHYPTDILAGWAISGLIVFIISRIKNQNIVYAILIAIGIAGCFVSRSMDYYSGLGIAFGFIGGFIFEEKKVHFENTPNVLRIILRTVGGLLIFLVLDTVLKLPFSKDFLETATGLSFMVRTIRYAIVSFVLIGVYPMLFKVTDKFFKKKKQA